MYGIHRYSGFLHFVAVPLLANGFAAKVVKMEKIPGLRGLARGVSTIDVNSGRYFFIGVIDREKRPYELFVMDCRSGKTIKKHAMQAPIEVLTFNPLTDNLTGVVQTGRTGYDWLEMDIKTGNQNVIKRLPAFTGLHSRSGYIDSVNKQFLFLGEVKGKESLIHCHLDNRDVSIIDTINVSQGSFRVFSWSDTQNSPVYSTHGVQSCTGITGFSNKLQTGFLAHVSNTNQHIPELLEAIDKALISRCGKGLASMNITVLGGRRDHETSIETVIAVYNELKNVYGLNIKGSPAHHLGKSYAIAIRNGKILIF